MTATANRLLSALSIDAQNVVLPHCVPVVLGLRAPFYEAERVPAYAYFITSGMASIVASMEDGGTAEVGIVGVEGLVGSIYLLGPAKVSTTAFMQLEGSALRIPLPDLRRMFRSSEEIRDRILEFHQGAVAFDQPDCRL